MLAVFWFLPKLLSSFQSLYYITAGYSPNIIAHEKGFKLFKFHSKDQITSSLCEWINFVT